jgi:NAD(P)-dependent dehydrogenase (short-subunit alcohol dehydrogenase family)
MFDLTGKVAIVTGGAGGLGRPISIGLAKAGADVVVDDLEKANPQAVADEIKALGRKALAVSYGNKPATMLVIVNTLPKA